jgi:hypothetical protein
LLADGKPPSEFRLFRSGINESDYGPILFDELAAQMVMEAQEEKGNPLYFDCNHGMLREDPSEEDAKSYGEFALEVRPVEGGVELWAKDCMWNEDGYRLVQKRLYNLFSPAFSPARDSDGVVRPGKFINCALVNRAGLDHIKPLAAAARNPEDTTMTDQEIKALKDQLTAAQAEVVALKAKDTTRGVLMIGAVLGLAAAATDDDRVDAVKSLVRVRDELIALSGKSTVAEAIGLIKGWKESHAEVGQLRTRETERETVALAAEFDALVKKGVDEFRIWPAEVDGVKKLALAGYGGKATKEAIAEFAAYLPTRPVQKAGGGEGPKQPKRETAGSSPEPLKMSAKAAEICGLLNIPQETRDRAMANLNKARERRHAEAHGTEPAGS